MNWISILGFTAAALTTFSTLPQFVKIIKTHQVRDISLGMYVMMATGVLLWAIYGFMKSDLPLILANTISLALCSAILTLKLIYRKQ
jgi:MtN3 and saliva related transmembrane protein